MWAFWPVPDYHQMGQSQQPQQQQQLGLTTEWGWDRVGKKNEDTMESDEGLKDKKSN